MMISLRFQEQSVENCLINGHPFVPSNVALLSNGVLGIVTKRFVWTEYIYASLIMQKLEKSCKEGTQQESGNMTGLSGKW